MIIRPGTSEDLVSVTSWLRKAGLPSADLGDSHMADFLVADDIEAPVGAIGIEQFDDVGLLRSLIVDPDARGSGVGKRLVAALEAVASSCGVSELWLLTIDADAYFSNLGYEVVERNTAPDSIRNTAEFSKLCPGDAVLMRKRL